jgi:putative oxidoreductase
MATATTQTQQRSFNTPGTAASRSRALTVALWIITVATAGMFLMAGSLKLAGAPEMVQTFEAIGLGQWFRYLTGTIEVVSAIALLIPSLALYGALALAATMIGAILTHLVIIGGSPVIPVVLLVATSFIAWTRWRTR